MAQYDVTHSCGHQAHIELFGKLTGRERVMEGMRGRVCDNCRRAAHAASNAAAAEANSGLPALTGSDRQIAWAESIRHSIAQALEVALNVARTHPQAAERAAEVRRWERAGAAVMAHTSAGWWIDHRSYSPRELLREAAQGMQVPA